jgi:glucose-1-phosphate cytidylyltransferase
VQVVILAGGLGTRLSEETEKIPKPMVTIGDEPILLHIMRYYASFGHTDFIIALGYKGEVVMDYFELLASHNSGKTLPIDNGKLVTLTIDSISWTVSLVDTGLDTATGGRVLKLKKLLNEEFMLTYGDGLSNVDLDSLVHHHKQESKIGSVTAVRPPARFGSLAINGTLVERFSEKNPQDVGWINGGFFCFSKAICDYILSTSWSLEGVPLEQLVAEKELTAFQHEGFWQPMDTLRDKKTLETIWNQGDAPWKR